MGFEDLSAEIQEKLRACKTEKELRELAESLGARLSDDELEAIAGGVCTKYCGLINRPAPRTASDDRDATV